VASRERSRAPSIVRAAGRNPTRAPASWRGWDESHPVANLQPVPESHLSRGRFGGPAALLAPSAEQLPVVAQIGLHRPKKRHPTALA
jgi:hypothetical protein